MEEHGVVIKEKGATVLIRTKRGTSCESCVAKDACHSSSDAEMLVEAENPVGARVGDHVVFTVGAGSVLKAGLLFYLVPLISFIAGVVLGQAALPPYFPGTNPDLLSGAAGVLFLAIAFIGLKAYGKALEKSKSYRRPQVLRVV